MAKLWSQLSPRTQAKYKKEGITPGTYNAWHQKTPTQRTILGAKAKREGHANGLLGQKAEAQERKKASARTRARKYAALSRDERSEQWPANEETEFWDLYKSDGIYRR